MLTNPYMPFLEREQETVLSLSALNIASGNPFRQYVRVNLTFLDQVIVSGVNFLTGVLLARFLGLEEFGRFTLLWMLVLLVNMVQLSLVLQPMMSLGPKQEENDIPDYLGAIVLQQTSLLIIFSGLTFLLGLAIPVYFPAWKVDSLMFPMIAVVVAFQAQEFVRRYFLTRQRIREALINDMISYGSQMALLMVCFHFTQLKTGGVLWIIAVTSFLAAMLGLFQMEHLRFSWASFREVSAKHWQFSRWLVAGSFMQWLGGQFFVMVSAAILSASAAGAIAAARNILGLTMILFAATENIVSVRASLSYKKGGWHSLCTYIAKVSALGGIANGLICLVAAVFASFWMTLLFGKNYGQYTYLIYWFSATHFLMFFIRPLSSLLRTVERTQQIGIASVLPMVFSILASVPLIRQMGLTGAMIVMIVSQMLILLYLVLATVSHGKEEQKCG